VNAKIYFVQSCRNYFENPKSIKEGMENSMKEKKRIRVVLVIEAEKLPLLLLLLFI